MNAVRPVRATAVAALLACLPVAGISAQEADERLARRLDPATAEAVQAVVDSLAGLGLPTEPLVQRALEGGTKGARPDVILAAVREAGGRLARARELLGADAGTAELVAGAAALAARVGDAAIRRSGAARPGASVAFPLLVLVDLRQNGVDAETADRVVLDLLRGGVSDADFVGFRSLVLEDVRAGVPPASAAVIRARGFLDPGSGQARRRPMGPFGPDGKSDGGTSATRPMIR